MDNEIEGFSNHLLPRSPDPKFQCCGAFVLWSCCARLSYTRLRLVSSSQQLEANNEEEVEDLEVEVPGSTLEHLADLDPAIVLASRESTLENEVRCEAQAPAR